MTHHHGHGGAFGVFMLVAAIAFTFGKGTAQTIVGGVLIAGGLFFAYVMIRIVMGTI